MLSSAKHLNFNASDRQNGQLELLQLLHRNRRIFLEEARSPFAGVAARLGHHGSLAEGGRASGSCIERNRPGVRELRTIAPRRQETAEEPGLLHGRSPGSRRGTVRSRGRKSTNREARSAERNVLARRSESVLCTECCATPASSRNQKASTC